MGSVAPTWLARWVSTRRVVLVGSVLVAAQLLYRAWAVTGAWFQFDDFAFMVRVRERPLDGSMLFEQYGGHLMPGGFLLSHAFADLDPLDFTYPALTLVVLQLLASAGCLFALQHLFGQRWGIIPALCVYLFSAISMPAFIWWAAGVNQLPMQAALFWATAAHVSYLRTQRFRYAVLTVLVIATSLFFYEKSLLVFGAVAIITVGYFATGRTLPRLRYVLVTYRGAIALYAATGVTYLVLYATRRPNLAPGTTTLPALEVGRTYLLDGFATGIVGGPLGWDPIGGPFQVVAPATVTVILGVAAVLALVVHVTRTRRRSRRGWLVPLWFLACGLLLIGAARASVLGPVVGLEYRYQSELPAAVALGLALATLPVRGALETVERTRPSPLLDRRLPVVGVTVAVTSLGLVSSYQYAETWRASTASRDYFTQVRQDLGDLERRDGTGRTPLANISVPQYLMWGYQYPENTTRRVLGMYDHLTRYPEATLDELYIINDRGRVRPAGIPPTRTVVSRPGSCGYRVGAGETRVPLDGPVSGGGWWVRLTYVADGPTPMTIQAGDLRHEVALLQGLHSLYFTAAGDFGTLELSGVTSGTKVCTNEGVLGVPEPFGAS